MNKPAGTCSSLTETNAPITAVVSQAWIGSALLDSVGPKNVGVRRSFYQSSM